MDAGRMDRRITLERFTETRDAFNEPVQTWAPLATVWASKEDIRDGERWSAQEVGAEVTTRFRVRWSSVVADLNPKDRVQFDGRTYDIVAVKEIGRREGLEITASARAD
ncbi:phage head closure protein [Aurantimonas endophytica]|uniref:phage head closure protein n=1 Tax=Aurantimonas endophytica TaxID=1522175 RepID=UPI003AB9489B